MTHTMTSGSREGFTKEMRQMLDDQADIADRLQKENPALPAITAFVMAGDIQSAQRATSRLLSGEWTFDQAMNLTGSYARFDWVLEQMKAGRVSRVKVLKMLPELWRGSDPDDTNPEYLRLWYEAWVLNDHSTVRDGRPLPRKQMLEVFRGQFPTDKIGFAWTLDPKIAQKFANGAGVRVPTKGGVVYRGLVSRNFVLAYLTGRQESEVIIDPKHIAM